MILNQQVGSKGIRDANAVDIDGNRFLPFNPEPFTNEKLKQYHFVGGFEQAGAEALMQSQSAINGNACKLLNIVHLFRPRLRAFVPSCEFTMRRWRVI